MSARIVEILKAFGAKLWQTPLLLGWLFAGLLLAFFREGWMGLALGAANLLIAGFYALIIHYQTQPPPAPEPVKRPALELAIALGLIGLLLVVQLLDFEVWGAQPWQGWVRGFFRGLGQAVYGLGFLPEWAKQDVYLAASSTIKQLLPALLIFLLFGYGWRAMGLSRPHWKLAGTLVGITSVFGLLTGVLTRAPLVQVLVLYAVGILVNALPEELLFRGLLLSRLEAVFANPLNALVVSALIFNAIHLPIDMANGRPLLAALGDVFRISYTGLIWGCLYLRTRSILPGVLWHAANTQLGFIFLEF